MRLPDAWSERMGPRQWGTVALVAGLVAAVRGRQRIGLPSALATACAFAVPPVFAAGFPRSRGRDGAVWAAQMWAYKNAFEMPGDREERLRRRAHFDYPIAVDARNGGGTPPSQRLAGRLRQRGNPSPPAQALNFFCWTWEIEPHLVIGWIRFSRPDQFPAAAGRLAATFDTTLLGCCASREHGPR